MIRPQFEEKGLIKAHTATGSVYEFDKDRTRVRRVRPSHPMRSDYVWLKLNTVPRIVVGTPMVLFMEPLGEGNVTIRTTSVVKRIEEDK